MNWTVFALVVGVVCGLMMRVVPSPPPPPQVIYVKEDKKEPEPHDSGCLLVALGLILGLVAIYAVVMP
jgi:hypothetical protein